MASSSKDTNGLTASVDGEAVPTLRFSGEVDLATASVFRDCLHAATDSSSGDIVVNLAGVTFMDSTGIGCLVAVANQLDPGRRLVVQHANQTVQKVFDVTQLTVLDSIAVESDYE